LCNHEYYRSYQRCIVLYYVQKREWVVSTPPRSKHMSSNPLFPPNDTPTDSTSEGGDDAAVRLIREKVARAFSTEPDAKQELTEIKHEKTLSKHQRFMKELSSSGKSLAEIQTAWHHYYVSLPDTEKHQVWQEFYAANQNTPYQQLFQKQQLPARTKRTVAPLQETPETSKTSALPQLELPQNLPAADGPFVSQTPPTDLPPHTYPVRNPYGTGKKPNKETVAKLKRKIVNRVNAGGKLQAKHHVQSLLFGLGAGAFMLLILLFSFFNEYVIAPFIQPSRTVSATPIILGDKAALASSTPQVLIPKINVQIPLVFDIASNEESAIQSALEEGIAHYPSTVLPGQNGNTAFFGHSSNNIFNPGKYKFAFVLLRTLTTGDTFYLTYNGKAYAYQVFAREVVDPDQVSVLSDTKGKTATAVLITCDPPGTTQKRLVVWGEQISPSVASNTAAPQPTATATNPAALASNGPSLWSRMVDGLTFWN
jgi:LPXTG-site transpeptidase (sortase) family protein